VWGLTFSNSPGYLRFVRGAPAPTSTPTAPTPTGQNGTTADVDTGGLFARSISEFDPYGDHSDPHVTEAPRATDGNLTTAWRTQVYKTATLGNLKPGVGLLVDLGSSRKVGSVHLRLLGSGTSVTVFDSDSAGAPASEKAMSVAAKQDAAPSDVTLRLSATTSARYWVVWLTRLPSTSNGFQGGVAEVTFLP
jgi:eukaryotic-like serine/threonine-protein kinase